MAKVEEEASSLLNLQQNSSSFYLTYLEDPTVLNNFCSTLPAEYLTPEYLALFLSSEAKVFLDQKKGSVDFELESI